MKRNWIIRKQEDKQQIKVRRQEHSAEPTAKKSLVQVRFADVHRSYSYYNDQFDLKEGDLVYVSGCLAGTIGYVESVNYRFKVNLADYERVLAHLKVEIHGTYHQIMGKLVSYDADAIRPEMVRSWVKAPVPEDENPPEFVQGEGYSFDLEHFVESDEVESAVLQRALDYCRSGRVRYLTLRNGIGTAFIEGSTWYEVNFTYKDGVVSDLFCECPYSKLCKHNLAVLITPKKLLKEIDGEYFTAVDWSYFMQMLSVSGQDIRL